MLSLGATLALLPLAWGDEQDAKDGTTRSVTPRDGETIPLQVRVSDASTNVLTVVTFPDPIQHVVSSWNPKDLSVEHETTKLFIKLLAKVEGHLDVVTSVGKHYRLYVAPAPATGRYDSHVTVKSGGGTTEEGERKEGRRSHAGPGTGPIELIKAMRLGQIPPDATVRSGKKEVLFASDGLEARFLWVFETGRYRGYVVELSNKSADDAYYVDVSRFRADNLVLIGAREVVVRPQTSTRVYLVLWK